MNKKNITPADFYHYLWTFSDNENYWYKPATNFNLNFYGCWRKNAIDFHIFLSNSNINLMFFNHKKSDFILVAGDKTFLFSYY